MTEEVAERYEQCRKALTHFKQPFHYEPEGQVVCAADGSRVVDIRGWGYLTGKGASALGYNEARAEVIQDHIGRGVTDFLNGMI